MLLTDHEQGRQTTLDSVCQLVVALQYTSKSGEGTVPQGEPRAYSSGIARLRYPLHGTTLVGEDIREARYFRPITISK
jgi:hypothetical protein